MIKKLLSILIVICMMFTVLPVAQADGGYFYYISNYEELVEWMNNGFSTQVKFITPDENFGWPSAETVLDFSGHSFTHGLPLRNAGWTIPANVTIKNLSVKVEEGTSLTINGKWYNAINYPSDQIIVDSASVTLGKGAEVTGYIRLCRASTLTANNAYAEGVMASQWISAQTGVDNYADIYGTLTVNRLELNSNMNLNVRQNCKLTLDEGRLGGDETNELKIYDDAEMTVIANGGISLSPNITVMSGGTLTTLANFPRPENVLTIEEGGVVDTYEGISITTYYPDGAIKGKGTINIRGWGPFRYEEYSADEYESSEDYFYNPGNIPGLDAGIIINYIEGCDHANGRAYRYSPNYTFDTDVAQCYTHTLMCISCGDEKGSEEAHTYVIGEQYDTGAWYECEKCNYGYFVEKLSGNCGDDTNFTLEGDKLTIVGTGDTYEFTQEDAPWAEKADKIELIEIGEGVTGIGQKAFDGCTSLTTVSIPDDVKTVDASAFASCNSISKVCYDGTYEQWKQIDVKEGNDAFLYAEIIFNDNSRLLEPSNEYRGKADMLLKTSDGQEVTDFKLSIICETEEFTKEEKEKIMVFVAIFDENHKLERIEIVPKSEADERIEFTGGIPLDEVFKMMVWSDICVPMARCVEKE